MIDYYNDAPAPTNGLGGSGAQGVRKDTPAALGGTDGDIVTAQFDSLGNQRFTHCGGLPTYRSAKTSLAVGASATDIAILAGSATKTVKVHEVRVSAAATAAIVLNCQLLKRSTAFSGGTSTAPAIVPHDSGAAAATAVFTVFTAPPTTGTLTGAIATKKLNVGKLDGTGLAADELIFDIRPKNGEQPVTLRGVAEALCVNLNGESIGSGGVVNVEILFTEEATTA